MNKNLTHIGLLILGFSSIQAQTTVSKVELNETFEVSIDPSIISNNNTIKALQTSENNSELELVAEGGPFFDLFWSAPDLSAIDSLIIEFRLDTKLYGDSYGNWNTTKSEELNLNTATNYELNFPLYTASGVGVYISLIDNYHTYDRVLTEDGYYLLKKKIVGSFNQGDLVEILTENEELETEYTLYTYDEAIVSSSNDVDELFTDFCSKLYTINSTSIEACFTALKDIEPLNTPVDNAYIDNLKITSYSTVTAIEDLVYNNKVVSAVYNTMGHEVTLDTKNETLIVKYTDGSSERIFNAR